MVVENTDGVKLRQQPVIGQEGARMMIGKNKRVGNSIEVGCVYIEQKGQRILYIIYKGEGARELKIAPLRLPALCAVGCPHNCFACHHVSEGCGSSPSGTPQ